MFKHAGTHSIRFVMLGGFLGSGKTTTIARLARCYQDRGLRVAIITNDQASDLVDTQNLKAQGFNVGEIAGACFCNDLSALTETVERLGWDAPPDVCLIEPIGSCTDLMATVIRPLADSPYGETPGLTLHIAPYGVIVKPSHAGRILRNQQQAGFSPKAAYVLRKQLEEADFLIINRIDELPPEEVDALERLVAEQYPGTPVVRISAKTGEGLDQLCEFLEQPRNAHSRVIELDYDAYAEAESELGWLNCRLQLVSDAPFPLDDVLKEMLIAARQKLAAYRAEIAHLKIMGTAEGAHAVVNLVSSANGIDVSSASNATPLAADIVVNARIAVDPLLLSGIIRAAIAEVCQARQLQAEFGPMRSFRPARPLPVRSGESH
jgi:G3E family GTPase